MASLKTIGAWALTEPSNGSDASALQTTAKQVGLLLLTMLTTDLSPVQAHSNPSLCRL